MARESKLHSSEQKRRLWELIAMVAVSLLLVGLSRLETRLFNLSEHLSENTEFLNSVIYFGLININVVLILILGFLIFRNVAKLVLDRRRGILGSKLRTKLVVSLVFFAVAPVIMMFYISNSFITTSFDTWFSTKVLDTMQRTRQAGAEIYKRDQKRLESLARIARQRISFKDYDPLFPGELPKINAEKLSGFDREYGLTGISVYDHNGTLVWSSFEGGSVTSKGFSREALVKFQSSKELISWGGVEAADDQDIVKGVVPILYPKTKHLVGVMVTEEHFEARILSSIETILKEFAQLRPDAKSERIRFQVMMVLMILIIVFAASWLGFYVARGIVSPIQRLAEATKEVALGNYNVNLEGASHDEAGILVKAFNKMTVDLREHERQSQKFTKRLQESNEELNRRHAYMKVVLKNISAGVIAVDTNNFVTSFNSAAERLLDIESSQIIGLDVEEALGEVLSEVFWLPVSRSLSVHKTFSGELDLRKANREMTLFAAGIRIFSENNQDLGTVLVFDDATERAKAQRVAAWREVARRIAHEIKNPITPIKLSAQRLLRRYGNQFQGEDQKVFESCIETILTQVDSLRDLVNEFSKFSRLPEIKTRALNVNDVISEIVGLYRLSYPDIHFDCSGLSKSLPQVPLDKEQINRMFMNLITNAIAALQDRDHKYIKFKSAVDEQVGVVRVEVSDNGVGIPTSERDKIFQPYYSTKKDGSGLGLAIVNQIVSDHGGYIRLVDRTPQGTKAIVELPLKDNINISDQRKVYNEFAQLS